MESGNGGEGGVNLIQGDAFQSLREMFDEDVAWEDRRLRWNRQQRPNRAPRESYLASDFGLESRTRRAEGLVVVNPFVRIGKPFGSSGHADSSKDRLSDSDEDHPDSFFKSMRIAVQLAQVFGFLPVTGYGGPNYKSIRFRYLHWKTAYFAVAFFGIILILACSVVHNLEHGISYDKSAGLVFFGAAAAMSYLLFELTGRWREVNRDFAEMELKLRKYGYPVGIGRRFKIATASFMTLALVEHLLSRVAEFGRTYPCAREETFASIVEAFFVNYYYEIFRIVPYSPWKGVVLVVLHVICTFAWNFTDLVLALVSWTISKRFERFNQVLFRVHGQDRDESFWKETRKDYNELADLTRKIDSHVQKLMLLSLGDNLYFICIQLLKGLKKSGNLYETIYFLWSVGFLILRTCFVAFTAAAIHDESKEAKSVLYSVPEGSYCAETRRFLTQLATNDVALTGCRFFSITRGLILTIAGTVVTYEVILVQFNNEAEGSSRNATHCVYF